MKVALFVTCFNDTLFPEAGRAVVELLERLGCEVEFPLGADLLRADARQLGLRATRRWVDGALRARLRRATTRSSRPRRRASRMCASECPAVADRVFELTEFLVDRLGVVDVGASFPHRVTLHPTCHSLRLLEIGDRPRRLLEAVRGIDLVDLDGERECCGFGGTFAIKNADTSMAMLSDKVRHVLDTRAEVCTSADTSCLMHIGGALRRQRDRRAHDAPGGDPGGAGMKLSGRGARVAAGLAAAPQHRQGDDADPRQARARGRRAARLGGAARRRRGDQGAHDGDAARAAGAPGGRGHARGRHRALGARRRRGQRDRGRDRAAHGADEVIKVKSLATDEIGMNEALEAEGIHALETDLAELIVQLAGRQAVAHPRARDPPQPRRDPRAVRAHDRRGPAPRQTRRRRSPRPRACTCARSSCPCRSRSRARTSGSPRPARSASSSPRATGACA